MKKLKANFKAWKKHLHEAEHHAFAKFASASHLTYYALVAVESHYFYSWVAGLLALAMVVEHLLNRS